MRRLSELALCAALVGAPIIAEAEGPPRTPTPSVAASPAVSAAASPHASAAPVAPVESATAAAERERYEAAERRRRDQMIAQYEAVERDGGAGAPGVPKSFVAQLVQTVLMLIAVCALAYLLLGRLLPRVMGMTTAGRRAMVATPTQGILQVVDRIPLDARRAILVVRVGGEHFMVGVGESGMSMLARLDDSTFADALAAREQRPGVLGSFARLLERRLDAPKEDA